MKYRIAVLMFMPVIFFGISFKVISHPVMNEKIESVKAEAIIKKGIENKKNTFFLRQNYVLPLEQMQIPDRKAGKEDILIKAKSVLAIDDYSGEILYQKDAEKKIKIASLTKLATAGTLLDFIKNENVNLIIKDGNYSLDNIITISKTAIESEGDSGSLMLGEKIKAGELLKIMLIASSNDAARAIAEDVAAKNNLKDKGVGHFVEMMNAFAKKEGMDNTNFTNSHGIDEKDNYSTAKDMVELSRNLLKKYPEIFGITLIDKIIIKSADGKISHSIKNTNRLLGILGGIAGGKTGYTDEAGESLLLVVMDPTGQHRIIAVVIGAEGRFTEMEKLVNWIWDTYEWR